MKISTHCGGFCQTNGYLIEAENGAVAIDAPEGMFHFCKQKGIKPTGLLLTHQHFDHVEDAALFHENKIPIYASEPFCRELQLEELLRTWGLTLKIEEFAVDHILTSQNSPLPLAGLELELLPVPGHSPDSFVFHVALFHKLFGGDTLFADGGIGRTDFPHGDHDLLIRSIREQLLPLPANTEILPGHGPPTTIGQEILKNPYLA